MGIGGKCLVGARHDPGHKLFELHYLGDPGYVVAGNALLCFSCLFVCSTYGSLNIQIGQLSH